ncbi:hypothetical protein ACN47E_008232 [Coniothyrium glycines]
MIASILALLSVGLPRVPLIPSTLPGFTLTWSDNFIGAKNSLPNPANWIIDTGTSYPGGPPNWGNSESQTYTSRPENLKLTGDGLLQITPLRSANNTWTSARIETQRTDFQAREGGKMLISARIKMPDVSGESAAGYWPAFWTLGGNFRGDYWNWPSVGEFDIMENVNGVDQVWGVLHCGVNPGGPCQEATGLGRTSECPESSCQGNWHVYSFEVDRSSTPEKLTWSVDGKSYHNVTENDLGASTWADTVHKGHFILLNVAMGGSFPNGVRGSPTPTSDTVSGVPMYVDWVAVYNSI